MPKSEKISSLPKSINLTVDIRSQGTNVWLLGRKLPMGCDPTAIERPSKGRVQLTIPKHPGLHAHQTLSRCMEKLYRRYPSTISVLLMAEHNVAWQEIVQAVDAIRQPKQKSPRLPCVIMPIF